MKSVKNTLTEWKLLLKRVKIIPKCVKITPKKSENHSNRVNFTFWGSSQRDSSFVSSCPSVRSPSSEIHSIGVIFTLFGVIFTHFGMIFTRFESDFHSGRVFFTLFTLLKSNHFTLFTLNEIARTILSLKKMFQIILRFILLEIPFPLFPLYFFLGYSSPYISTLYFYWSFKVRACSE